MLIKKIKFLMKQAYSRYINVINIWDDNDIICFLITLSFLIILFAKLKTKNMIMIL